MSVLRKIPGYDEMLEVVADHPQILVALGYACVGIAVWQLIQAADILAGAKMIAAEAQKTASEALGA